MPIDWTKLNTIFKKANKRYPNVPSIDGKTESHTQALLQIKEALDIAQRRSGDIRDSFVRVGELEELGLFDNIYQGRNLGNGKRVYKRTDESTQLKYHEFRTLVAGTNITLTQTDNTIEISSGNGSSGNTEVTYVGDIAHRCGDSSTSFTPNENPDVAEGDLCVWVVVFGERSNLSDMDPPGTTFINFPAGWSVLQPPMYINDSSAYSDASSRMGIFYRWLSAADINTLFTCTETATNRCNTVCSFALFFRDVDPTVPFGSFSQFNVTNTSLPMVFMPLPVFSTGQKVVNVFQHASSGVSILQNSNFPMSTNESKESEYKIGPLTVFGGGSIYFHGSVIPANIADDENLIEGETISDSIVLDFGNKWSAYFVDKTARTPGTYKTRLTAQTVSTEHYVEYEIDNLLEGFWYSAYALIQIDYGQNEGAWLSIIDPNGKERSLCCAMQGNYFISERAYLDPYNDRNTNWRGHYYGSSADGVSSEGGGWWWIQFKAMVAGTHKLRIYLQNSNGLYTVAGRTFNTSGVGIDIGHVGFRSGRYAPKFTYTPNGVVSAGQSRLTNQIGWMDDVDINRKGVAFVVNPRWDGGFPYSTMFENTDCVGQSGVVVSAIDGHITIHKPSGDGFGDDDSSTSGFRTERAVFPTMEGGAAGKYYAEVHFGDTGVDAIGGINSAAVGVQYMASDCGNGTASNQAGGLIEWYQTSIYDLARNILSAAGRINDNDIIGVAVDYDAGTATLYRNGVLAATTSMPTTGAYPTKNVPYTLFVATGFGGTAVVRLRPPFAYTPPSGHVEWDWYGNVDASPYLPGTTPTGGGARIIYVDESGVEKQRTLLGSGGIVVTQYQEYITIGDTPYTCSNRGNGHIVFAAKVGYDFQFKSLVAGVGIALSSTDNEVTIHSTAARYLTDLLDVDEPYPINGHYLKYTGSQWEGALPTLQELTDTNINVGTLSAGQVLTWSGTKWANAAPTGGGGGGGGGGPVYLNDILDVYCPYPNPGDVLTWTGYDWQCSPGTLDGLADVNAPSPDTGLPLVYNGTEWRSGNVTKVETFTVSGSPHTWNKDPKAKAVEVWCIGGGGGGGAGYLGAVSTNRGSGAGGGSAGISSWKFRAEDLPDTVTITVGAGGTGGVGRTGAAGAPTAAATAGGTTSFGTGAGQQFIAAGGGGAGASGAASTTASTGGTAGTAIMVSTGATGGTGDADAAGATGGTGIGCPGAGGGGAGSGTTNQVLSSGAGGASGSLTRALAGGTAIATVSNTNGTDGNPGQDSLSMTSGGSGGSGGGCGHSTTALNRTGGNGGKGGFPGGGGGGGGASTTNGAGTAGNGGNGGDGVCVVITYF